MFIRILVPESKFFTIWIPDPHQKYFNPKKWFLSSRKYDPGSIPDPGVKKAPDPGFGSATLLVNNKKITRKDSYVITCPIVRDHMSPGAGRDSPRS
jgi:hypothetical protein